MALAILELEDFGEHQAQFKIDTGTNGYYQLKIGRSVRRRGGIDWVDDVYYTSRMMKAEHGGNLLGSSQEIAVPTARFDKDDAYVQLFSFKTPEGRAPAFSRIVRAPVGRAPRFRNGPEYEPPLSLARSMTTAQQAFRSTRRIGHASPRYARATSLEDLLGGILKAAGPALNALIGSATANPGGSASAGAATGNGAAANNGASDALVSLLRALLGGLQQTPSLTKSLSTDRAPVVANRFLAQPRKALSKPFIFGIDDALLGALIGPALQVLPQLANAANQHQLQMKQADNKLASDVLSEANRRMLMEQLIAAQEQRARENPTPSGGAGPEGVDLGQLIKLLQAASPAATPPGAPAAAVAPPLSAPKSLARATSDSSLSERAVVTFTLAPPLAWGGQEPRPLFARGRDLTFKIMLSVAPPVPSTPLPKALGTLYFKNPSTQAVLFQKTFQQKSLPPNTPFSLGISAKELEMLPANRPLSLFAELRWQGSKPGAQKRALGSTQIVLVESCFAKARGATLSAEQELTDLQRYRPFWNKVWESPSMDAVAGNGEQFMWELDVNAKYTFLLSGEHEANGLMDTRLLKAPDDPDSLTRATSGRMKAGIELSLNELNKLLPLWSGEQPLSAERLAALNVPDLLNGGAGELLKRLKLRGRKAERGMIWIGPVLKLVEFVLCKAQGIDETGQVTNVAEETVRFPLPVAARVLGLKSQ